MRNHYPIRFASGDGTTVNLHFVDVDKDRREFAGTER